VQLLPVAGRTSFEEDIEFCGRPASDSPGSKSISQDLLMLQMPDLSESSSASQSDELGAAGGGREATLEAQNRLPDQGTPADSRPDVPISSMSPGTSTSEAAATVEIAALLSSSLPAVELESHESARAKVGGGQRRAKRNRTEGGLKQPETAAVGSTPATGLRDAVERFVYQRRV
jgi:hypothetical protein